MRVLVACLVMVVSVAQTDSEYDLTEGVVIEAVDCSTDAFVAPLSIYHMTMSRSGSPTLRVSLYYDCLDDDSGIILEEIWYDDVEGWPHRGDTCRISGSALYNMLGGSRPHWFVRWIDKTTFEMESYDGECHSIVEYMGDGIFRFSIL